MVCGMRRTVIGICAALERARWSVWDQAAALLPMALHRGRAARRRASRSMLPPDAQLAEEPDELLDLVDGLMLAGGADIDP